MRAFLVSGALLAACTTTNSLASEAASTDQVAPEKDGWVLAWSDEFNGDTINSGNWTHEVNCWGGGNEERQCYTDREINSFVEDGKLYINALLDPMTGPALPVHMRTNEEEREATKRQPFTSARLNSKGKADFLYGRMEVRAKIPHGQGMWPAIWMLPTEDHYGTWAASGEIDIAETVNWGAKCDKCEGGVENRVIGTIHYGGEWPKNRYKGEETEIDGSIDDFHDFAVEWSEGEIKWFINDRHYLTLTSKDWRARQMFGNDAPKHAPFDRPFHFVLNIAVGGHLAESKNEKGVDLNGFPKSMIVDYVRVYQRPGQVGLMPASDTSSDTE